MFEKKSEAMLWTFSEQNKRHCLTGPEAWTDRLQPGGDPLTQISALTLQLFIASVWEDILWQQILNIPPFKEVVDPKMNNHLINT